MLVRILVVDDEYIVRLGITSMLPWEEHGYTICGCVKDGNEALEKIPVLQPDIILTDVMMQPMDGLTLLQRCAHEYPHIRFIMLSNYTDFQNVKRAMQLGASDYIFKLEISETELLHSLDNLAVHHDASSSQSNYADLQADSFFLKHNLLEKLMLQDLASPHTQSLLCQLSVMPSFANYRLVALQAKVYTAEGNDSFSFKRAVQNLIESILPSEESLCFWYKDNTFLLYLPLQANDRADFDGRFEQIYNYAKRYLGASVIGATSAAMQGISQFASAASSTFSMLQMHFYAPDQKFFQENALCAMPLSHQTLQIFLQKTLPAFLHQPQEECAAVMADIFNALAQYHMLPALFKKALTSLFELTEIELQKALSGAGGAASPSFSFQIASLNTCETLDEIQECCVQMIQSFYYEKDKALHTKEIILAQEYVLKNLDKKITLQQIAQHINMSESYFSHLFKTETGKNFVDYVNGLKIDQARTLLRQTNLKVNEIAWQLGFDNSNYFNILFKRIVGCAPGIYREAQST